MSDPSALVVGARTMDAARWRPILCGLVFSTDAIISHGSGVLMIQGHSGPWKSFGPRRTLSRIRQHNNGRAGHGHASASNGAECCGRGERGRGWATAPGGRACGISDGDGVCCFAYCNRRPIFGEMCLGPNEQGTEDRNGRPRVVIARGMFPSKHGCVVVTRWDLHGPRILRACVVLAPGADKKKLPTPGCRLINPRDLSHAHGQQTRGSPSLFLRNG
jgi:hypothetical protein